MMDYFLGRTWLRSVCAKFCYVFFFAGAAWGDDSPQSLLIAEIDLFRAYTQSKQCDADQLTLALQGLNESSTTNAETLASVARLRFLRQKDIINIPALNVPVVKQLQEMGHFVRQLITRRLDLPCALTNDDFIGLLLSHARDSIHDPLLTPHLRTPLSVDQMERWRLEVEIEVSRMVDKKDYFLLNSSVPESIRDDLEARFWKQTLDQFVLRPAIGYTNAQIRPAYRTLLNSFPKEINKELKKTSPPSKLPQDVTEFDLSITSQERVYALVLSLLPALDAGTSSDWHICHASSDMSSQFPPFSKFTARMTTAACSGWWILVFSHFESSDGNLLSASQLQRKCFVLNRENYQLYEYDQKLRKLILCGSNEFSQGADSVYFQNTYNFGDLHGAASLVHDISVGWRSRDNASGFSSLQLFRDRPEIDFKNCSGEMLANSNQSKSICFIGNNRSELQSVDIPPLTFSFGISAEDSTAKLPVVETIFPNGCRYKHLSDRTDSENPFVSVTAPSRLQAQTHIRPHLILRRVHDPKLVDVELLCQQLIQDDPVLRASRIVESVIRTAASSNPEVNLLALEHLVRDYDALPTSWQWKIDDLRVGLLVSLNRRTAALKVLRLQSERFRRHLDRDFVEAYFRYYSETFQEPVGCLGLLPFTLIGQREVEDAALELIPGSEGHERLLNQPERSEELIRVGDRVDTQVLIASQVLSATPSPLADYAEGCLERLLQYDDQLRHANPTTAKEINEHWKKKWARIADESDPVIQATLLNTLLWRTWHKLRSAKFPLDPPNKLAKSEQLDKLRGILQHLPERISRKMPDAFNADASASASAEVTRSISRLEEYASSAFFPEMYRPLSGDAFGDAIARIEGEVEQHIADFESKLTERLRQKSSAISDRLHRGSPIDFFQRADRIWVDQQCKSVVAHSMGAIVRYYGLTCRNFDFSDKEAFPFAKIRGLSVVYRRIAGLDSELHVEWFISPAEFVD